MDAEAALYRAQEEISALCGERPDEGTETVFQDIEDMTRSLMRLRRHLETMAPWRSLKLASDKSVDAKLAWEAHHRFQRNDV